MKMTNFHETIFKISKMQNGFLNLVKYKLHKTYSLIQALIICKSPDYE